MKAAAVELELPTLRAVADDDADEVFRVFTENGFLTDPERFEPERLLAQLRDASAWYMSDEKVALTPELASAIVIETSDPRSSYFDQMRHQTLPSEHVFARRVEMLTMAVLSQLRAENNWFSIMSEWLYDDEPQSELGRLEAEYFASRAAAPGADRYFTFAVFLTGFLLPSLSLAVVERASLAPLAGRCLGLSTTVAVLPALIL